MVESCEVAKKWSRRRSSWVIFCLPVAVVIRVQTYSDEQRENRRKKSTMTGVLRTRARGYHRRGDSYLIWMMSPPPDAL